MTVENIDKNNISDEEFMLSLELGRILQNNSYDDDGEIDKSKITDKRALEILNRLEQIAEQK